MAGNVEIIIPVGFQNLKILETLTILLKNKILVSEIVKKSLFICKWVLNYYLILTGFSQNFELLWCLY